MLIRNFLWEFFFCSVCFSRPVSSPRKQETHKFSSDNFTRWWIKKNLYLFFVLIYSNTSFHGFFCLYLNKLVLLFPPVKNIYNRKTLFASEELRKICSCFFLWLSLLDETVWMFFYSFCFCWLLLKGNRFLENESDSRHLSAIWANVICHVWKGRENFRKGVSFKSFLYQKHCTKFMSILFFTNISRCQENPFFLSPFTTNSIKQILFILKFPSQKMPLYINFSQQKDYEIVIKRRKIK